VHILAHLRDANWISTEERCWKALRVIGSAGLSELVPTTWSPEGRVGV